jgi:phosphatidylserine/phosphatidylglycerophosphate/cardiolipin synthase-like enzyme
VKVYPDTLDRLAKAGATVRHLDMGSGGILHAKYFIVDGREAFIGSQNLDWRALEHNLELGARIRDAAIAHGLASVFAIDWAKAGGEPAPAAASRLTPSPEVPGIASRLTASPEVPGIAWDVPALVALLDGARRSIHVELLTYLAGDWTELEAPLSRAAARGVDVVLAVADWSLRDKTLPGLRTLARLPHVAVEIITIPQASTGFIPFARVAHAKLLVVDGARGWLGTANWEREYFYDSRNVGLLVDGTLAARLDAWFADALRYAKRLDPDGAYTPPRIE